MAAALRGAAAALPPPDRDTKPAGRFLPRDARHGPAPQGRYAPGTGRGKGRCGCTQQAAAPHRTAAAATAPSLPRHSHCPQRSGSSTQAPAPPPPSLKYPRAGPAPRSARRRPIPVRAAAGRRPRAAWAELCRTEGRGRVPRRLAPLSSAPSGRAGLQQGRGVTHLRPAGSRYHWVLDC